MVCMHVGCYSATLRWDRFGRRQVEPPSQPAHPPHLQASIYTPAAHPLRLSVSFAPLLPPRNIRSLSRIVPRSLFSFFSLVILPPVLSSISPRLWSLVVAFLLGSRRADFSSPLPAEFLIYFPSTERNLTARVLIMQSEFFESYSWKFA